MLDTMDPCVENFLNFLEELADKGEIFDANE